MSRILLPLALLACLSSAGVAGAAQSRPNLVLLLTDDQCCYSLGCYGNPDARTPEIDRLARDGLLFENHYDTTAICMASRASVFTGRFEYRHGCNFGRGNLTRELWRQSYPTLLREAGYRTAIAGKIGIEVCEAPGGKGQLPEDDFDAWGASAGQTFYETARNPSMAKYADRYPHSTLSYGAFARDFIRESAGGSRPFCLSISFKAPHRPATPDPRFDAVYAGKSFAKPANYGRQHGLHFSRQSRQGRQYSRFTEWKYDRDYDRVMATYHQQVHGVDAAVGMIRQALEDHGVADNTVVIFTSDNGFLCGSHGYGSKVLPYEEASRAPLIVFDPRRERSDTPRRCEALTGNVDFAPTMLQLAGVEPPDDLDGRSLVPLLENPKQQIHAWLPLINVWGPEKVFSLAVVTPQFKYIYWPYAGEDFEAAEELYDLRADRLELKNVAAQSPQLSAMREIYDQTVKHWRETAVGHHGYARFATLFDRDLDWPQKQRRMRQQQQGETGQ